MIKILNVEPEPCQLEGRDYLIDERGRLVMSRESHLARGQCCDSKCLNCPYMNVRSENAVSLDQIPVISMVPSWTETLLWAGARVVGRTRFCVHPQGLVSSIAVFGGTKNIAPEAHEKLKAQIGLGTLPLVVLDREENPLSHFEFFSRELGFNAQSRIVVTDVKGSETFGAELDKIAAVFRLASSPRDQKVAGRLDDLRVRYERVTSNKKPKPSRWPGLIRLANESAFAQAILNPSAPLVYVIWQNPWMAITAQTWIGSTVTSALGIEMARLWPPLERGPYPEFSLSEIPKGAVVLLSTEPFPFGDGARFEEQAEVLIKNGAASVALVDGEVFSWFGIRSIRFLEGAALSENMS